MKQLIRNLKIALVMLLIFSLALGAGLVYQQQQSQTTLLAVAGENKAALRQRYAQAGQILSRDGVVLASSENGERVYAEDLTLQRSLSQLVGDYTHHMSNTIETQYQSELLGNQRNVMEQFLLDVTGRGLQGSDIHLTIHALLNEFVYEQMKNRTGSAVLLNYKTGEILAMVSTPATTMANIVAYKDIPDTALFNRSLNGRYAPGSTFKIMTSAAWLSSGKFDPAYTLECNGDPVRVNGARDRGHGTVNLDTAFTLSCNVFFGEAAVKVGAKNFYDYLVNAGLGRLNSLDRLSVSPARYQNSAAADDRALLSWFGTGQPVGDLVLNITPLELALMSGAVANGGNLVEPHVVRYINNPLNQKREEAQTTVAGRMFSPQVATRLQQMMLEAVASGDSIQTNARIEGLDVGGKSGTVEIGTGSKQTINALWTGFLADPEHPYAVAVVVENASGTNTIAVAIGGQILKEAARYEGG